MTSLTCDDVSINKVSHTDETTAYPLPQTCGEEPVCPRTGPGGWTLPDPGHSLRGALETHIQAQACVTFPQRTTDEHPDDDQLSYCPSCYALPRLTTAVSDRSQCDAVLQQILFGPMVHGGAYGQHGARLLLLQHVWRHTRTSPGRNMDPPEQRV